MSKAQCTVYLPKEGAVSDTWGNTQPLETRRKQ